MINEETFLQEFYEISTIRFLSIHGDVRRKVIYLLILDSSLVNYQRILKYFSYFSLFLRIFLLSRIKRNRCHLADPKLIKYKIRSSAFPFF